MHPILFHVPLPGRSVPYHAYGFFLAVAFIVGISLLAREARKQGVKPNQIVTMAVVCVITSLIGSRAMHLLMVETDAFLADPMILFDFARGGYAFYGGFAFAVGTGFIYCRIVGLTFLQITDMFSLSLPFGLVFGRIGCLLAGCCHGRPVERPLPDWLLSVVPLKWPVWFSLTFPAEAGGLGSIHDTPLVPTQPLSSLYCLAIFLVLGLWVYRRKRYHGQVFVWVCILYAIARSTIELFRGDDRGLFFGDTISSSQLVSVPAVLIGLGVLGWARWRINTGRMLPLPEDWRAAAAAKVSPKASSKVSPRAKKKRKKKR